MVERTVDCNKECEEVARLIYFYLSRDSPLEHYTNFLLVTRKCCDSPEKLKKKIKFVTFCLHEQRNFHFF